MIADYLSDLTSAESRLNNAFNPLKNIRNYVGKPFGNSNLINEIANCISNYNNAYINYINAKINYQIFYYGMEAIYFILESIVSDEISKKLEFKILGGGWRVWQKNNVLISITII